jgi:hypothetical protein
MADLMDGWEEDQEDDADGYGEPAPAVGGGMGDEDLEDDEGFDDDYDDEDDGIFSLEKLDQNFGGSYGGIKLALARSGVVTMATETGVLIQFDVRSQEITEIEMPVRGGDCDITGIFGDDAGKHYLISAQSNMENNVYYLQPGTRKPKKMDKLKGHEVSAVGWDNTNKSDLTTSTILLGTQDGHFFETKITKGKEEFWHLLYTIKDKDNTMAGFKICGIDVQQLGDKRMYILASTPTRLYEFSGGPTFEALFGQLGANPSFQELPGSPSMHSELHLFTARARRERQFAWLTGAGIYTGKMTAGKASRGGKAKTDVVKDKDLKPYPCVSCGEDLPQCQCDPADRGTGEPPRSIGLTEFHFMLLYDDQLQVVNQLSSKKVFDEPFRMTRMKGDPRGLLYDPGQGSHWLYTDRFLFRLNIVEEDRTMWELHLEKEQYEEALVFCKNSAQKDAVLTKQATKCFEDKKYDMAATFYAKTTMSFEEITLKFVSQDEPEALRMYLGNKLDNVSEHDDTQRTLLCTWLVEIYMDNINHADGDDALAALVKEFKMFLTDQKLHLDPTTTYNLLSSHGRMDELLFFAELLGDFERVITHYIQVCDYKLALETLQKNAEATQHSDLYYKFSPALMAHVPYLTVSAWLGAMNVKDHYGNPLIEPRKLIPALMRYDPSRPKFADSEDVPTEEVGSNQAVKFLLECIEDHGVEDPAVSNYLISVLAQQPSEEALLRFLNNVATEGSYDVSYALRQCMAADKQEAVVYLYGELGLYEEAVERALGLSNLELALANADRPGQSSRERGELSGVGGDEESAELRKRLWLRIARHVVTEKDDIRAAINLMAQSDGLLKIEDILPFFPGFARIDDFKDEICNALDGYNQHITNLKEEMRQVRLTIPRMLACLSGSDPALTEYCGVVV